MIDASCSCTHDPTPRTVLDSSQLETEDTEGSVVVFEDGRLLRRSARSLVKEVFPSIDCHASTRASSEPPRTSKPCERRTSNRARSSVAKPRRREPVAEEKRKPRRLGGQRRGTQYGASTISPPRRPSFAYSVSPTHTYGTRAAVKRKETRVPIGSGSVFRLLSVVQWDPNDKRRKKQLTSLRCIKQEEHTVEQANDANEPGILAKNSDATATPAIKAVLLDAVIKTPLQAPPEVCKTPEECNPIRSLPPVLPTATNNPSTGICKTPDEDSPIRVLPPAVPNLVSGTTRVESPVNAIPAAARNTSPSATIEERRVVPRVVRRVVRPNPASQNTRVSRTVAPYALPPSFHHRSAVPAPSAALRMVTRVIHPRPPAMTSGGVVAPNASGTRTFREIGSAIAAPSRLGPKRQVRTVAAPVPIARSGGTVAASPQTRRWIVTQPLGRAALTGADHRAPVDVRASGPAGPPYPFRPATVTPRMAAFRHLPTAAASSSSRQPSAGIRPADAGPGSASEVRTSLQPTTTTLEQPPPPVLGDENMDPAFFEMLSQVFVKIPDENFKALVRERERRLNQEAPNGRSSPDGNRAGAQVGENNLEPQPGCSHWSQ